VNDTKLSTDDRERVDAPTTEEIGRLLDERAALARDPKRKKFTLKQIAARHNVRL
jgi:hypothetical protein